MSKHSSDYNIILVNLDGLRQDKVEFCDNLNSLKEKSVYFSNMVTVSPYTLTAHHSIITGLYPSQHGIDSYHHMFRFKKNVITVNFEEINDTTKVTFEADYILPNFIIGIIIDRLHIRKQVINGMDSSLQEVKKSVEEKHKETVIEEITVESKN